MISNNNMGCHNKLAKLEEKKKLELQLLKINYDLSTEECLNDKTIKLKEKELHKLLNKQFIYHSSKSSYKSIYNAQFMMVTNINIIDLYIIVFT